MKILKKTFSELTQIQQLTTLSSNQKATLKGGQASDGGIRPINHEEDAE